MLSATLAPILLPCRGITLTVGPASNNKSHKNGAFCIDLNLDLFVLFLYVGSTNSSHVCQASKMGGTCLRLDLGLNCQRPKIRDT